MLFLVRYELNFYILETFQSFKAKQIDIILGAKKPDFENYVKAAVGRISEDGWTVHKAWMESCTFTSNTLKERLLFSPRTKEAPIFKHENSV
jgi:hypothetical protein